eukprot:scaffold119710_cov63-Phaeocystis_antarctica.AAC.7
MPPIARPAPPQRPHQKPRAVSAYAAVALRMSKLTGTRRIASTPTTTATALAVPGSMAATGAGEPMAKPVDAEEVEMAESMKTGTAAKERYEKRDSPQSPCPEVHPLPTYVPIPMTIPSANKESSGSLGFSKNVCGTAADRAAPAESSPSRYDSLLGSRGPTSSALSMPEWPAIFLASSM